MLLGLVLLGNRVVAALVRGGRVIDTFTIAEVENPGEALRVELESRKVKPAAARLGIERSLAIVKTLTLPATSAGTLEQMVQFELDRHLPFQSDDAAFGFVPLPAEGETARVLVTACERRIVDHALRLVADAPIKPISLTVAAHDLVPLLARRPRGERAVWVHSVGEVTNLLFLHGNALVLSRTVRPGDATELVTEIRGTAGMLRWPQCDAVWTSGDGADLPPDESLETLGAPIAAPPLSRRAQHGLQVQSGVIDGPELLAGAVAIAPRSPALNLLPQALRPRRLSLGQKVTMVIAAVTAGLGFVALLAPGIRNERELARIDREIRALDSQVRSIEQVSGALDRERKLLASVKELAEASLHPLPVLRELTDLLPSDVWLTALTLEQKGAELVGQAATASNLIPLLEESPRLQRVEFASPVTRGRDKEQFRIKAFWENGTVEPSKPPKPPPPVPGPPQARQPNRLRPPSPEEIELDEPLPPPPPPGRGQR